MGAWTRDLFPGLLPAGSGRLRWTRRVFWPVFLAAAAVYGRHVWTTRQAWDRNPLIVSARTRYELACLRSRDPRRAGRCWQRLQVLYRSSWQAFGIVADHFLDDDPIHFRVRHRGERRAPWRGFDTFWVDERNIEPAAPPETVSGAGGEPVPVSCLTVGEALLAMAYNDNARWAEPYRGDWRRWYQKNREYYPLSVRRAGVKVEAEDGRY